MNNLQLKCYHKPTKTLYDAIVIVNDKRLVKVRKTRIKQNDEVIDELLDKLPLDECEFLINTTKQDDSGQEIFENDFLSYGEGFKCRGTVVWNYKKLHWDVDGSDYPVENGHNLIQNLGDLDSKYIHRIGNRYGRYSDTNA